MTSTRSAYSCVRGRVRARFRVLRHRDGEGGKGGKGNTGGCKGGEDDEGGKGGKGGW